MNVRILAALAAALIGLAPAVARRRRARRAAQIAAAADSGVNDFLAASPEVATFLGDYSHDGDWSDPTPAGIAHFKAMLSSFEQKIDAIDMTGATLQDRNDVTLMRAFLVSQRRAIADQEAGKDPSGAPLTVLGAVFTMMLHKDEQDPTVWWDHVISRMEKAPAWMAAQRAQITHPGRLQAQVALKQLAMAPALFYLRAHADGGASLPADQKARFVKARDALVAVDDGVDASG